MVCCILIKGLLSSEVQNNLGPLIIKCDGLHVIKKKPTSTIFAATNVHGKFLYKEKIPLQLQSSN